MSQRKMTPKGQMSRSANSGPAVMMMPPHIRATFMPNPPLKHIPLKTKKRRNKWTGVANLMVEFERTPPPPVTKKPTPKELKAEKVKQKRQAHEEQLAPKVEAYRQAQRESAGEFQGMNCYNTLFVGRLAYEVTERRLLREMETYGPIKDLKIIKDKENKSRGYAFIEFEVEDDMKRAFRAADGMRLEGREIVVDVERGHTVPNWLPRRLGGGLGGTRLGGKDKNYTYPGRFDPERPEASRPPPMMGGPPGGMGHGRGQGPPPGYGGGYGGRDERRFDGPSGYNQGPYGGGRGRGYSDRGRYDGPPRGGPWERDRGGGGGRDYGDSRKRYRSRSRSPDRRHHSRRRY